METKSNLNKKYPECAVEVLALIRSNLNRFNKLELMHLAYEYVFFCEYKKDQNIWIKVNLIIVKEKSH